MSSGSLLDREGKYPTYPYAIQGSPRSARWQMPIGPNIPEPVAAQPQSPSYMNSPLAPSADVAHPGRYLSDRKLALLTGASYVFPEGNQYHNVPDSIPNSRSMSPSASTASSATSLPLTSSYPLGYQNASTGHEASDFEYQAQPASHSAEVTLHGGVVDVTGAGQHPDGQRYRLGGRSESGDEFLYANQVNEAGSQREGASHLRIRRDVVHPYHRSPSPGPTPLSCTVAVIKAQAFGALRRTRTKAKKTTDGAAKVALDVLEARGINIDARHSQLDDGDLDEVDS